MMVVSSPRLSAFVLAAIPIIVLPLYAFGRAVRRRSRSAQDTLAEASAYAAELIGAVRVLQAFTNERLGIARFRDAVERAFSAARNSIRARAHASPASLFSSSPRASSSCCGSVPRTCWPAKITPGRLGQFILYAVLAGGALGSLSEIGGEVAQASGAAERLFEILAIKPAIARPRIRSRCRRRRAAKSRSRTCTSPIRRGPIAGAPRRVLCRAARREARHRRPVRRRQEHDLPSAAALLRSDRRPHHASTASSFPNSIRRICARASRSCRRTASCSRPRSRDNIRFGRPDASDAESRPRRRACARRCVHRRLPARLRHAGRRARRYALRRPAPAHRHRARHPARRAASSARRGDFVARCRKRDADRRGARAPDATSAPPS